MATNRATDIQSLQDDLAGLRRELERLTGRAARGGRARLRWLGSEANDLAHDGGDFLEVLGHEFAALEKRAERHVRAHPVQSATLLALGVGLLLALIFRR